MLSIAIISVTKEGDQVVEEYSSKGLTYVLNALTKFIGLLERKHLTTKDLRWFALETIPFMCFFEFKF